MTSRERVLRAIEHKEPDRLPRDFDATPEKLEALVRELALTEPEIRDRFRCDLDRVWMRYNCPYDYARNIWGLRIAKADKTENVAEHPLAGAGSVAEVECYAWPDPAWADVARAKAEAAEARRKGRAVACSSWGSIFGEAYRLMGMDAFLLALALNEPVVDALVARLTDFFLEVDRRVFTDCRGLIDLSFHGNDFGTQRALLFSRAMFRRFFAPHVRRLADQAHSFGLKAMFHSCGAVREIIDDLIDCGIDVLDPVQVTAAGMDPRALKRDFGSRITFHGGISAQKVLPLGTPDDVRAHVRETCDIMRPGGGYIFAPDQAVTDDTPTPNVLAMYDALDELGY
jgi:uroporphyrinogen decarboxylase